MSGNNFNLPKYESTGQLMKAEVDSILNTIKTQMFQENKERYPEERFRKYFAPFFLGIYEVPAEFDIISLWISEVGSSHIEVEVVNEKGEVIFVVPPMINNNGLRLDVNGKENIRFNSLENIREEDSKNNPQKATLEYFNGVSHKLSTLFKDFKPDPTHADKWLKIFEYYNVTPPSTEEIKIVKKSDISHERKTNSGSSSETNWNSSDFSFDPEIT